MDRVAGFMDQWRRERPELDPSPMGTVGRMRLVSDAFTAALVAHYRSHGLGEGEFDILATLRRNGAPFTLPQGELADHTMVTAGATSKRVDRMEAAGLVERHPDPADARGRVVGLTDAGRELIDRVFPAHLALEDRLLAALEPAERAQLERLLAKLLEAQD